MKPDLIEKHRAAKELIEALREASAKEVSKSWAELFGRPVDDAPPRSEATRQIHAELLARLKASIQQARAA